MTDIHPDYGPAAQFSEHRKGDHIKYKEPGIGVLRGEILWVAAPTDKLGVRYIVAPEPPTGFVDFVYPADVVMD